MGTFVIVGSVLLIIAAVTRIIREDRREREAEPVNTDPEYLQRVIAAGAMHKNTSHVLHLLLTIITVGLWLPVWILVAVSNHFANAGIDKRFGV